jgi:hypothetical protein
MGGDDATSAALASADALYASGDVAAALDVYAEVFGLRESPPANVLRERLASSSSSSSSSMRRVLYTGPHTTAFARWTPILKDFCRRVSAPTPRFQSPPSTPFNST